MLTGFVTLIALIAGGLAGLIGPELPSVQGTNDESAVQSPALSADEIAGLRYMVEEEKLAHDVYTALSDAWGLPIFANIASSEATHQQAVRAMLTRYGVADPSAANPAGIFSDPALQALYDQMLSDGQSSLAAALRVGATIEEVDILDLQKSLATRRQADVTFLYERLLAGSGNHLRAYTKQIERVTGEPYAPQYLSDSDYQTILAGSNGRGNGQANAAPGGRGQGGQFGRGGQNGRFGPGR